MTEPTIEELQARLDKLEAATQAASKADLEDAATREWVSSIFGDVAEHKKMITVPARFQITEN